MCMIELIVDGKVVATHDGIGHCVNEAKYWAAQNCAVTINVVDLTVFYLLQVCLACSRNTDSGISWNYRGQDLTQLAVYKKVKQLELAPKTYLESKTRAPVADVQTLYVYGCSITFGRGIGLSERFSAILSRKLSTNAANFAECGSGILYSANLIMTQQFNRGDIVIFGLTEPGRVQEEKTGIHYVAGSPIDISPTLAHYVKSKKHFQNCYRAINDAVAHVEQQGATVVLVDFLWRNQINHNNYIDCSSLWVDSGSDRIERNGTVIYRGHPGPKTHELYADKILEKLAEIRPDLLN